MNREQKRKLQAKKKKDKLRDAILAMFQLVEGLPDERVIQDGDKVMLNAEQIINRSDFANMQKKYRDFVLDNMETVFTAKVRRKTESGYPVIVDFEEDLSW